MTQVQSPILSMVPWDHWRVWPKTIIIILIIRLYSCCTKLFVVVVFVRTAMENYFVMLILNSNVLLILRQGWLVEWGICLLFTPTTLVLRPNFQDPMLLSFQHSCCWLLISALVTSHTSHALKFSVPSSTYCILANDYPLHYCEG